MKFLHLGLVSLLIPLKLMAGFSVSPLLLEFNAKAGSSQTLPIEVSNGEDRMLALELYMRDFFMEEDGKELELDAKTHPQGLSKHLELYPSGTIYLHPFEKRTIQVRIKIPPEATGSLWTKVYVGQLSRPKPVEQRSGELRMQIFIKERWEVRIHQRITGTTEKRGSISQMDIQDGKFAIQFENGGTDILRCQGKLEIKNTDGDILHTQYLAGAGLFTVYPESTRTIAEALPQDLPSGSYVALAIVDFGNDELTAGELEFDLP